MHFDRCTTSMDIEMERKIARHPVQVETQARGIPWIPAYAGMTISSKGRYVYTLSA